LPIIVILENSLIMQKKKINANKVNYASGWIKYAYLAFAVFIVFLILFMFLKNKDTAIIASIPKHKFSSSSSRILNFKNASKSAVTIAPYPKSYPQTVTVTPAPLTGFCLRVPIIYYHHIQPEAIAKQLGQTSLSVDNGIFDQQMDYLVTHGYTPIWADELVNALRSHTPISGKPILITMDDGYADNYTYALPILEKYNLKANLMLSSGLVDSNPDMLTWSEVSSMKSSGIFYFTNHTWSHWPISRGPQSKINFEVDTAQEEIQQHTGQTVNLFTYPYGSFNSNAIQTLTSKGYLGAFSTIPGFYQCDSFIMTLHRNHMGNAPLSAYGL
jgi:peptidoglycan/xylan/chitin deacetylase (PgdA/CDA1 family)